MGYNQFATLGCRFGVGYSVTGQEVAANAEGQSQVVQ
jgi:hypothetical protein